MGSPFLDGNHTGPSILIMRPWEQVGHPGISCKATYSAAVDRCFSTCGWLPRALYDLKRWMWTRPRVLRLGRPLGLMSALPLRMGTKCRTRSSRLRMTRSSRLRTKWRTRSFRRKTKLSAQRHTERPKRPFRRRPKRPLRWRPRLAPRRLTSRAIDGIWAGYFDRAMPQMRRSRRRPARHRLEV